MTREEEGGRNSCSVSWWQISTEARLTSDFIRSRVSRLWRVDFGARVRLVQCRREASGCKFLEVDDTVEKAFFRV